MNRSTVPHDEIGVRLSICCEFLLDEKKPIEEAYKSLMGKIGRNLMEYSEFEYWFKRFENNHFDLGYDACFDFNEINGVSDGILNIDIGYDTSLDNNQNIGISNEFEDAPGAISEKRNSRTIHLGYADSNEIFSIQNEYQPEVNEIDEISNAFIKNNEPEFEQELDIPEETEPKIIEAEHVTKDMIKQKMDYRFDVQDVPVIFQTHIKHRISSIEAIRLTSNGLNCLLKFDDFNVRICKRTGESTITYGEGNEKIRITDPEKSIIDHLWFVLRDSNLELNTLHIGDHGSLTKLLDFEKLNSILQSMFISLDHPIHISNIHSQCFNEDTFYSMLQAVKPKTLEAISFEISWKEEGNYLKMEEIVQLNQWKLAKSICSNKSTSLTIYDVLHCEKISLRLREITPEDVIRVKDNFLESPNKCDCILTTENAKLNFKAIESALQSENRKSRTVKNRGTTQIIYRYPLQNSENVLRVTVNKDMVVFARVHKKDSLIRL